MHASTLRPARPLASRTLEAAADLRPYGEFWGTLTRTVTLTNTPAGIVAEVDGQAAPLADAVSILRNADRVKVLAEVPATDHAAPVIGKATARELHRELGRLGFRDHYTAAAEVLERPVPSLAALTAEEAHTVRSYARGQWGMSA